MFWEKKISEKELIDLQDKIHKNLVDNLLPIVQARRGSEADKFDYLRNAFAMSALQGLLGSEVYMKEIDDTCKKLSATSTEEKIVAAKVVSETAFFIADAMLTARNKTIESV